MTTTDALSHTISLSWSVTGTNLLQSTDGAGQTTAMSYDALNNLTAVRDARGVTTTYSYSGTLPTSITDANGHVTHYTYTTLADAPQPPGLV